MINKYILDEIMRLESDNSISLFKGLEILKSFNIELISDEKYNIVYRVKLGDILDSDLENSKLLDLRNGGWKYDKNQEYLIKNMNEQ